MKIKLRPHQEKGIQQLRAVWKTHRVIQFYACVAFGKTATAAYITNSMTKRGMKVLFIAPYTVLVEQTAQRFMEYGLDQPSIIWRDHPWHDDNNLVQIASADTLIRRQVPDDIDLIIWDECFSGDTKIQTSKGTKRIDEITKDDLVFCFDEENRTLKLDNPVKVYKNGTKEITIVKTSKGQVKCTSTHLFYTGESWIQAKDLNQQQRIMFRNLRDSVTRKLLRAVVAVARKIIQDTLRLAVKTFFHGLVFGLKMAKHRNSQI